MSFYPELEQLDIEKLIAHFQNLPIAGEEDPFLYYSEVALTIREKDEAGISFLQSQMKDADAARLAGIIFALTQPPQSVPALSDLLLDYLEDDRGMVVAEAVDGLWRLGEKNAVDRVLVLKEHPESYVRGSVLRYMARLHPDRGFPLLIAALKSSDFIVRENAADELGELGAVAAIPDLRPIIAGTLQCK